MPVAILSSVLGYVGPSLQHDRGRHDGHRRGLAITPGGAVGAAARTGQPGLAPLESGSDRLEDIMARLYRAEEVALIGASICAASRQRRLHRLAGGRALAAERRRRRFARPVVYGLPSQVVSPRSRWSARTASGRPILGEHFDLPLDHLHEPAERRRALHRPEVARRRLANWPGLASILHGTEIPPVRR